MYLRRAVVSPVFSTRIDGRYVVVVPPSTFFQSASPRYDLRVTGWPFIATTVAMFWAFQVTDSPFELVRRLPLSS